MKPWDLEYCRCGSGVYGYRDVREFKRLVFLLSMDVCDNTEGSLADSQQGHCSRLRTSRCSVPRSNVDQANVSGTPKLLRLSLDSSGRKDSFEVNTRRLEISLRIAVHGQRHIGGTGLRCDTQQRESSKRWTYVSAAWPTEDNTCIRLQQATAHLGNALHQVFRTQGCR